MEINIALTIFQIIIMILLFIVIIYLIRENIAIKHEIRIGAYSIDSENNVELSFVEKLKKKYYRFIRKLRKPIGNMFKITKKKYEKYTTYGNDEVLAEDFVSNKIIISVIFSVLTIISKLLQQETISIFILVLNLLIGFYILDVYLFFDNKRKTKLIKNEMLRAIIIMNNAFKSGKSTLQAVEIASSQLPSPINKEFYKIYKEMKYGLSVDVVFERFSKRINIPEAKYLSSSLTILNKTGGNIIKVFSSIERTLFDKMKLEEELKNLTSSSNFVVKILLFVPFIFVGLIYLLNPDYFTPLFTSNLGLLILGIIIVMFAIYILFLQKVMKVRM